MIFIVIIIVLLVGLLPQPVVIQKTSDLPTIKETELKLIAPNKDANKSLQLGYLGKGCSQSNIAWNVILDTSSSMNVGQRITQLRKAVINLGGKLSDEDIIGIQEFNSYSSQAYSQDTPVVFPIAPFSNHKASFDTKINQLQARGSTHMKDAFVFAKSKVDDARPNYPEKDWVIVFFSDGIPSPTTQNPLEIASEIKSQPKTKVVTLGLFARGSDSLSRQGPELLRQLASTPQDAYEISDENLLQSAFAKIFENYGCK